MFDNRVNSVSSAERRRLDVSQCRSGSIAPGFIVQGSCDPSGLASTVLNDDLAVRRVDTQIERSFLLYRYDVSLSSRVCYAPFFEQILKLSRESVATPRIERESISIN